MGLAVGVFGGRIEVEDVGMEREGFPEGWWIMRDSQPSPATQGRSSRKKVARRSQPGDESRDKTSHNR